MRKYQEEGYAAYEAGARPWENPYPWADRDRCMAWARGYNMARTERIRANRAITPRRQLT